MRVYFSTMRGYRGQFVPLQICDKPSRESRDRDIRWTITASADVTDDDVKNIRVESVDHMEVSWSTAAGYRHMTEDHEGQNPDLIQHLNERISDLEWDDILTDAAVAAYERELQPV